MLVKEKKNDFGIFIAIPKANGWVWVLWLRLPNDYRWISGPLCEHLGIEQRKPSTEDLLRAIEVFIDFEKRVVEEGYLGWMASTPATNYKMIRFFDSVGAKEYKIDEFQHVWFGKYSDTILNGYSEKNVKARLERKEK